jgi:hypothetical protein
VRGYLRIGELARRTGVTESTAARGSGATDCSAPERSSAGSGSIGRRRRAGSRDARPPRPRRRRVRGGGARAGGQQTDDVAPVESLVGELSSAIDSFDGVAAQAALDRTFATLSVESALRNVLLPVMGEVGQGWEKDESAIAREHLRLEPRARPLLSLARGWDLGNGQRALLACAPEERHDIGS